VFIEPRLHCRKGASIFSFLGFDFSTIHNSTQRWVELLYLCTLDFRASLSVNFALELETVFFDAPR
jgi:hypothetical protein